MKGKSLDFVRAYGNFKLFLGYTLVDLNQYANNVAGSYPLVSKNRLNNVLIYEVENKFKIGVEAYYFSPQQLNDGMARRGYWLAGLMAERFGSGFAYSSILKT